MMDEQERELMELAAKAYGFDAVVWVPDGSDVLRMQVRERNCNWIEWNPRHDDGDSFRLAVRMKFYVETMDKWCSGQEEDLGYSKELVRTVVGYGDTEIIEPHGDDARAATREAIFRAAVETGRAMP